MKAELAAVKAEKADDSELEAVKAELEALKNKPKVLKGKIKANLVKSFEISAVAGSKAYHFSVTYMVDVDGGIEQEKQTDIKTINKEQYLRTGEKFILVLKSSKGFKANGTAKCIVEMIHDPNK